MAAKAKKPAKQKIDDPLQKLEKRILDLKAKLAGLKDAATNDPVQRKLKKRLRRTQRRRHKVELFNKRLAERHKGKKPAETSAPAPAGAPAEAAAEAAAEASAESSEGTSTPAP